MKEIYFKIIELPTHQVLLAKDSDEEGRPTLELSFFVENVKATQTFGFDEEQTRDDAFDGFAEEFAQQTVNAILSMLKEAQEEDEEESQG